MGRKKKDAVVSLFPSDAGARKKEEKSVAMQKNGHLTFFSFLLQLTNEAERRKMRKRFLLCALASGKGKSRLRAIISAQEAISHRKPRTKKVVAEAIKPLLLLLACFVIRQRRRKLDSRPRK